MPPNTNATKIIAFTALPGGLRTKDGFDGIGEFGHWWSSTERNEQEVWYRALHYDSSTLLTYAWYRQLGISIRCLKE